MCNWYVIYTKPRQENSVTKRIGDAGFEVLNPRIKEKKYRRGKFHYVISSLFPCYVFIKLDLYKGFRMVRYTRGVKRFVGSEAIPTALPEYIIESIKARMNGDIVRVEPRNFATGEEIRIKGGSFQGLEAIFEKEMNGVERVSVLLKNLNVSVVMDSAHLSKVSGSY